MGILVKARNFKPFRPSYWLKFLHTNTNQVKFSFSFYLLTQNFTHLVLKPIRFLKGGIICILKMTE